MQFRPRAPRESTSEHAIARSAAVSKRCYPTNADTVNINEEKRSRPDQQPEYDYIKHAVWLMDYGIVELGRKGVIYLLFNGQQ